MAAAPALCAWVSSQKPGDTATRQNDDTTANDRGERGLLGAIGGRHTRGGGAFVAGGRCASGPARGGRGRSGGGASGV